MHAAGCCLSHAPRKGTAFSRPNSLLNTGQPGWVNWCKLWSPVKPIKIFYIDQYLANELTGTLSRRQYTVFFCLIKENSSLEQEFTHSEICGSFTAKFSKGVQNLVYKGLIHGLKCNQDFLGPWWEQQHRAITVTVDLNASFTPSTWRAVK